MCLNWILNSMSYTAVWMLRCFVVPHKKFLHPNCSQCTHKHTHSHIVYNTDQPRFFFVLYFARCCCSIYKKNIFIFINLSRWYGMTSCGILLLPLPLSSNRVRFLIVFLRTFCYFLHSPSLSLSVVVLCRYIRYLFMSCNVVPIISSEGNQVALSQRGFEKIQKNLILSCQWHVLFVLCSSRARVLIPQIIH
jgi:hypothetical protein